MLSTSRTRIDILSTCHADKILDYYQRNRQHLAPWEPVRGDDFWTLSYWQQRAETSEQQFAAGDAFRFVAINPNTDQIIAVCNFDNIVRGAFQACYLGYSVDGHYQGQGYMTEALAATIDYMFTEVGLHRIMANYMPVNQASGRVLEKLGFEREGLARHYLKIAGQWQDHILTAKINDER